MQHLEPAYVISVINILQLNEKGKPQKRSSFHY